MWGGWGALGGFESLVIGPPRIEGKGTYNISPDSPDGISRHFQESSKLS